MGKSDSMLNLNIKEKCPRGMGGGGGHGREGFLLKRISCVF